MCSRQGAIQIDVYLYLYEYQPKGGDALRLGSKGGYFFVCGFFVCECHTRCHTMGHERFRDKGLIIKCYINSSVYFTLLYFIEYRNLIQIE